MNDTTEIKFISRVTILLVGLLAIGSLMLSFNALSDIAAQNGFSGWRAVVWPLLLDAGLIVFSLVVVLNGLQKDRTWDTWLLVGLFTVGTIGFNLSHANDTTLSRIMSVVPPLTLFLTFERLMAILRSNVRRRGVILSLVELTSKIKQLRQETAQADNDLTMARDKLATIDRQANDKLKTIDGQIADKQGQLTDLDRQANDIAAAILDGQETLSSLEKQIADAENRRQAALDRLEVVKQAGANLSAVVEADGKLSKADRQPLVLRLTKEGFDPAAIADRLGVVERTIKRDLSELNGQVTK